MDDALQSTMPSAALKGGPCVPACVRREGMRGVTLRELVVALMVLAVLASVAISRRSTTDFDAVADGEHLKNLLRNTRTRAMADIVPWTFTVDGTTGVMARNGAAKITVTFETAGITAGTVTFDNRGQPSGTMSFAVPGYPASPIVITDQTGFIP